MAGFGGPQPAMIPPSSIWREHGEIWLNPDMIPPWLDLSGTTAHHVQHLAGCPTWRDLAKFHQHDPAMSGTTARHDPAVQHLAGTWWDLLGHSPP